MIRAPVSASTRSCFLAIVALLSACGAPSGPSVAPQVAGAIHHPERAEAHLFGLTEDAFPELAPLWPALSARAATEVSEELRIDEDEAVHGLDVVVAGDLAIEALWAWREEVRVAGFVCSSEPGPEARCERDSTAIVFVANGGDDEDAPLEALASEMGVAHEPSSALRACAAGLAPARLAGVDARLHRAGLLEPWSDLHERLGVRRLIELAWTRSEEGDEITVRYRGDEEAFELATLWARENGLAGADGMWQRIATPLSFALELRDAPPEIELTLEREP